MVWSLWSAGVPGCVRLCMSCSDRAIAAGDSRTRTHSCATRSDSQSKKGSLRSRRDPRCDKTSTAWAAWTGAPPGPGLPTCAPSTPQFACDPLAVLRLPALTDVTVASTGRFVDAFAEAQALDTDTEPPGAHCARFASAVDHAWRCWRAAHDAAERIRLSAIPAEERIIVRRAIKLLTMARESHHDTERAAAYAKARLELAKLERSGTLALPPAAAAALNAAIRGQLPAARTQD